VRSSAQCAELAWQAAERKLTLAGPHQSMPDNPVSPSAQVYDGTPFLKDHPGGADSIMLAAGQDASDEFDAIHSTKAKAMLEDYYIGELAADTAGAAE